jgi:hypothetical protein
MPQADPTALGTWPPGLELPTADLLVPQLLAGPGAVAGGWLLIFALVGLLWLLVRRMGLPTLTPTQGSVRIPGREWGLAATICLVLAVVICWPMATSGALVQRNFDGYGSAWLLFQLSSGRGMAELLDTWLFAALGTPLALLLGPARAYAVATIIGLWSMGLATWWTARGPFGLPALPAGVAALAVMANPLVGSALAEGHGGILVGPGLPLLLGTLHRPASARPWRWALWVTGAAGLCALQSGYFAYLAAALIPLWCAWTRRPLWRVLALLALPTAAFAVATLLQTRGVDGGDSWAWYRWHLGALPPPAVVSLDRLAGRPPGADALLHGTRVGLIFGLLVLGVVVPLLRGDRTARGLALLGLVGVALALGPELRVSCDPGSTLALPLPLGWLAKLLPSLALFRLPARALWLYYLAAGLGAAWVVASFRRSALAWGAAGLLLLELMVQGARPWEPRTTLAQVPSAYGQLESDDIVLDLWPPFGAEHPQGVVLKELSCFYQTGHGRRLPMACLTVQLGESPLLELNQQLHRALLQPHSAPPHLRCVSAVAWHPDAFTPAQRSTMARQLEAWWGDPAARSADAGERVVVYRVGVPAGRDPACGD